MKTIVISAVNLITGGTLSILQECLRELSEKSRYGEYKVIAIVHSKELCLFPNIEYIEMKWPKTAWIKRLWCEYYTFKKVSEQIGPVYLWFSLHDTTPNVNAEKQAVYCHNSFPFFKYTWQDFIFYKPIVLFVNLTNLFYRINIHKNRFVIVQQDLMRQAFIKRFNLKKTNVIVAPPAKPRVSIQRERILKDTPFLFIYASAAGIQKNFETVCQAAKELEQELGKEKFKVVLTIDGKENKYAQWIKGKWENVSSIDFRGWISKEELFSYYDIADCLIFASRIESWGLPISEFKQTGKPMILADLPYAHETSAASKLTTFFESTNVQDLKSKMKEFMNQDFRNFREIPKLNFEEPVANDWSELFKLILK